MRIASIIPLIRVTPQLATLDYEVPEGMHLEVGTLVRIPFRNRTIEGVTWQVDSATHESRALKQIAVLQGAHLTTEQCQLLAWMHRETCTPLNVVARLFLPTTLVSGPHDNDSPDVQLIIGATNATHDQVISSWAKQLTTSASPALILCPSLAYAKFWLAQLPESRTVFLEPPTSARKRREFVTHLQTRQFFVTLNAGLFFPLPRLQRVIIDYVDDAGYFAYDQAPRVDLRRVARALARTHHAHLLGFARYVNTAVAEHFPKTTRVIGAAAPVQIIDRSTEPGQHRGAVVPTYLIERLASSRTLWLHNHLHEARRLVCKDCGTVVRCQTCKDPLEVQQLTPLHLWCRRDAAVVLGPERCKTCRGAQFSPRGYGLLHTAREIAKFVSTVSVLSRLERHTPNGHHVVATSAIAAYPQQRFDTAVIVQPDALLTNVHYRAEEEFLDLVAVTRQFLSPSGTLYVPTFQPEHAAVRALTDLPGWVSRTLNEREQLLYPPSGTLIVLRPRQRVRGVTPHPMQDGAFPPEGRAQLVQNEWVLRCNTQHRSSVLAALSVGVVPSWEVVVDPPRMAP